MNYNKNNKSKIQNEVIIEEDIKEDSNIAKKKLNSDQNEIKEEIESSKNKFNNIDYILQGPSIGSNEIEEEI